MDEGSSLQLDPADRILPSPAIGLSKGSGVEPGPVRRVLERSRLEGEVLRGVYERVLPRSFWSLGRPISVPRDEERQRCVGG